MDNLGRITLDLRSDVLDVYCSFPSTVADACYLLHPLNSVLIGNQE